MGNRFLLELPDVLIDADLAVIVEDGWETRARSSGGYDGSPLAVIIHHTASNASRESDVDYMCHGSSDRPLANLLLARDATWTVMAAGATNTNGKGGPWGPLPIDGANSRVIGIEAQNSGTGEPWSDDMQRSYMIGVRALCNEYGIGVGNVLSHFEWAPTRKIDPAGPSRWPAINGSGTWNMHAFRGDLAAGWPDEEDDDMPYTPDEIRQMIRDVLNEGTGYGLNDWADTNRETLEVARRTYNAVLEDDNEPSG